MITPRDLSHALPRSRPFSSPDWLFELKFGGFRALALRQETGVRLLTRHGSDLTVAFPEVATALNALPERTALDGELVIFDADGRPQFEHLGRAWLTSASAIKAASRRRPATLMAFDILVCAGVDVRSSPIELRKRWLAERVGKGRHLRPVLPIEAHGNRLYSEAVALKLEGIVAKRKGSRYRAGRTDDWLKIKTPHGREVEAKRVERLRT